MSSPALTKLKSEFTATAARLNTLASKLAANPPKQIETTSVRVRILFNKKYIADSTTTKFVWENPYYPNYYLPSSTVQTKYIEKVQKTDSGDAHICRLIVGDRGTGNILWFDKGALEGLLRFEFNDMDSWFEEDKEIYVHPKDPYKRVHIVPSSRHFLVKVAGTVVAESSSVLILFETALPVRYYLPKTSANVELLEPTATVTSCPYKGDANYYSIVIDGKEYKDYVWWYRYPTSESIDIAGRICFYNEKVDIYIDGVKQ